MYSGDSIFYDPKKIIWKVKKQANTVFLVLGVVAFAFIIYLLNTSDDQLSNESDRDFKIEDINQIDSIAIESIDNQVFIKSNHEFWNVNNHYIADKEKLSQLLNAIQFMDVKTIAPSSKADSLLSDSTNHISIKIYSNGSILKSYQILGETSTGDAYMQVNRKNAVVTINYIIGKDVKIKNIFNSDPNYWRDNTVLHYAKSDLNKIDISYSNPYKESFTISIDNNELLSSNIKQTINEQKLNAYLQNFNKIEAVRYLSKAKLNDIDAQPYFTLTITSVDGKTDTFKGYRKISNGNNDLNSFYLDKNNGNWSEVKYVVLDPILVNVDYFK